MRTRAALLGLALGPFAAAALGAGGAGQITMLTGQGSALGPDGTVRPLAKSGEVYSGETLVTGPNSYMNIKFADGGLILLRPNSRFQIEEFAYAGVAATAPPAPAAPAAAPPPVPGPLITAVEPNPVPPSAAPQKFTVVGSGFKIGATVVLVDLTHNRTFPSRAPSALTPTRFERSPTFGTAPSRWGVKIVNPDGRESALFEFGVGMPVQAVPQTAPPAAAVAVAPAPARPAATGGVERAFFRLLRGGFRSVTGLVGSVDRTSYRVSTPAATIGIRGTDYWVYLCDAACAADPVVAANAGVAGNPLGGVLVGVIEGGVFTANDAGQVLAEIGAGEYSLTLPDGTTVSLPFQPQFLQVDPYPDPEDCD